MLVRAHQVAHFTLDGVQRLFNLFPGLPSERLGLGIVYSPVEDEGIVRRRGEVRLFRGFTLYGGLTPVGGDVSVGFL